MEKYLKKIVRTGEKGLYLVNSSTGSSKSYSSVKVMFENIEKLKKGQHFLYVTNNLNNLPINDFKKFFGEFEYNKNVLVVESVFNNILNFIQTHKFKDPDFFTSKISFLELKKNIEKYQSYESSYKTKLKNGNSSTLTAIKKMMDEYRIEISKNDKSFRCEIRKEIITEMNKRNIKDIPDQKKYLKDNYPDLCEMYPTIFIDDYPIFVLSTKKFLTKVDTLFFGSYSFLDAPWLTDSIIFLDEFDATKDVINVDILDRVLNNNLDLIIATNHICNQFLNYEKNLPSNLKSILKRHDYQIQNILNESKNIQDTFKVYLSYYCDEITSRNFLLADSSFYEFFEKGKNGNAFAYYDRINNRFSINFSKDRSSFLAEHDSLNLVKSDLTSIFTVVRQLTHLIFSAKNLINQIAKSYMHIVNSGKFQYIISYEQALHSVYKAFKFSDSDTELMEAMQIGGFNFKKNKKVLTKDNTYYDRGMHIVEFYNDLSNQFNTTFDFVDIPTSAENIIATLAEKAVCIGLSATSTIDSVLSNYNLEYLKDRLGEKYHTLNGEDFDRIKSEIDSYEAKYAENGINVNVSIAAEELRGSSDFEERWKKIFGNNLKFVKKLNNKVIKDINSNLSDASENSTDYYIKQYQEIFSVFKFVLEHPNIKSFLILTTALPKSSSLLNFDILKDYFGTLKKNIDKDSDMELKVLKSGVNFQEDKEKILKDLEKGKKCLIMSSYATVSAGQNFVYSFEKNDRIIDFLENEKNDNDPRHRKKDLDGIYLGNITNVVPNLSEEDIERNQVFLRMIAIQDLYEHNEINYDKKKMELSNCFKKMNFKNLKLFTTFKSYPSYSSYVTKQVIQSVGRLNRTYNKNSEVNIIISPSILPHLNFKSLENQIFSPELKAIIKKVEKFELLSEKQKYIKNKAERISIQARALIREELSKIWYEKRVEDWKVIRKFVLSHPTFDFQENNESSYLKEMYVENGRGLFNSYYYSEVGKFQNLEIYFPENYDSIRSIQRTEAMEMHNHGRLKNLALHEISEENARLNIIMKNENIKKHFLKSGFACHFKKNKYVMCPELFQAIYKGALGEEVVKTVIEDELMITLLELNNSEYELFDFKFEGENSTTYIDAKHWEISSQNKNEMFQKIQNKLNETDNPNSTVLVINLFDVFDEREGRNSEIFETKISNKVRIIEIPSLLKINGEVNVTALEKIREVLK